MILVEVLERDEHEATLGLFCDGFMLEAFCYPFEGVDDTSHIMLYGFGTSNIGPCINWEPPVRTRGLHWGYHICAEVVDVKERLVKVKEIPIVLDAPIDSEFKPGMLIRFDVLRVDY